MKGRNPICSIRLKSVTKGSSDRSTGPKLIGFNRIPRIFTPSLPSLPMRWLLLPFRSVAGTDVKICCFCRRSTRSQLLIKNESKRSSVRRRRIREGSLSDRLNDSGVNPQFSTVADLNGWHRTDTVPSSGNSHHHPLVEGIPTFWVGIDWSTEEGCLMRKEFRNDFNLKWNPFPILSRHSLGSKRAIIEKGLVRLVTN